MAAIIAVIANGDASYTGIPPLLPKKKQKNSESILVFFYRMTLTILTFLPIHSMGR